MSNVASGAACGAYDIDFIVEVPAGKAPIVLQLSDPQIIDASQAPAGRLNERESAYWWRGKQEERCFRYIREVVERTKPDLILIAGDIVYGEFDHDGSGLESLIAFMEGFGIPWAPVLGNHETESRMGADWQCARLESAENCLFRQRKLTGNGNYTVGIRQAGQLTRVFYMMDSNSGNPSEQSLANGHSKHCAGFGEDQIAWYTQSITKLRQSVPDVKISFTFHIAPAAFERAFAKYGYTADRTAKAFPIDIARQDESGTDFGLILSPIAIWDKDGAVWSSFRALGVDSVLVGHDHEVCASVLYEGIRCQFGLKSSTYDSNIYFNESNVPAKSWTPAGTPMIGGTVMQLAADCGTLEKTYLCVCKGVEFEK